MSRSHRHNPVGGLTTARSEKEDKRIANRTLRAHVRTRFAMHGDERPLPTLRDVSDRWSMAKDGKFRFDQLRYPKSMRK